MQMLCLSSDSTLANRCIHTSTVHEMRLERRINITCTVCIARPPATTRRESHQTLAQHRPSRTKYSAQPGVRLCMPAVVSCSFALWMPSCTPQAGPRSTKPKNTDTVHAYSKPNTCSTPDTPLLHSNKLYTSYKPKASLYNCLIHTSPKALLNSLLKRF